MEPTPEFTPEELKQFEAMQNGEEIPDAPEEPEATPETAPEVEPEATPEPETKPEKPEPEKKVSIHALHEERMRRKEAQKRIQELEEKFARADERLKVLFDRNKDEYEDPEVAKARAAEESQREYAEKIRALEAKLQETDSRTQEIRVRSLVADSERDFESQNSDYRQALDHAFKVRQEALEILDLEPEEAREAVEREFATIVNDALRRGKNPAEVVYKMAHKMGYAKPQEPNKKIEDIQRGVAASKSLSQASGKKTVELTAEVLANMSDDEFEKVSNEDFRKLFGG